MRTDEQRIKAMHSRAAEIEKEKRNKKAQIIRVVSVAASFILVVGLAVFMSGLSPAATGAAASESMGASIFSCSSMIGYITIGVIAFVLGTAVTVLCYSLKASKTEDGRESRQ